MTVPKRFGVLRFIGTLLKVIAWIVLILSFVSAIGAVVFSGGAAGDTFAQISAQMLPAGVTLPENGIVTAVLFVVGGIICFFTLFAAGESLHMQLAVEENTRLTAALLLRLHQESQVDGGAAYGGGGFANEPFDR